MASQDYYMYSHSNRFTGNFTGNSYNARFSQPFEMSTSTQHRQFHEMKAQMPSDVLELFKANEIGFLKSPVKPRCRKLDPVTTTISNIIEMFDVPNLDLIESEKPESKEEKKARIVKEKHEKNMQQVEKDIKEWNPFQDSKITSDADKTLLVARLNYKTTEKNLKFEFEKYGIIKNVRIVRDSNGQSRGYGFVQFDNKNDFVNAYKSANYRKIDGHKIIVDFEKGRTLLSWRPRRFAGGQGELRLTKTELEELDRKNKAKKVEKERERQSRSRSRSKHRKRDEEKEKSRKLEKQRKHSKQGKEKKEKKQKKEKKDKKKDANEMEIEMN